MEPGRKIFSGEIGIEDGRIISVREEQGKEKRAAQRPDRCKTGLKTESGKDRVVPIHPYILPFVKELILADKKKRIIDYSYQHFKSKEFYVLMDKLNMQHTIHDTRDTFATLCQTYNVDVFARKRILGHKFKDLTFDTYTDTVIEDLYNEIIKIRVPKS